MKMFGREMKNEFIEKTKKEMGSLLWVLRNIETKEKMVLLILLAGTLLVLGINLYIPFVYKEFIAMSMEKIAVRLIILFSGLYALSLLLNYIFEYVSSLLSYRIEKSLKEKVYRKTYEEKEDEISEEGSSYYSEIIATDTKRSSEALNFQSINSIFSIFVATTAIIILGLVDIGSALISLVYFVFYIYIFLRPSMKKNKGKIPGFEEYSKLMENSRRLVSYVNDTMEGRNEIKAANTENYENEKFERLSTNLYGGFKNIWTQELKNFLFPYRFLYFLYYSLIFVWFYISFVINKNMTIDKIFFVLTYTGIISSNIEPFMNYLFKNRNYFAPSISKIKEIVESKAHTLQRERVEGEIEEIELKDVEFSYGENKILDRVNIKIKRGEKVALIGKSGEGKTTLVKIITGSEIPQKGKALMNGKEICRVENVYEKVGVLSQNSHIFNRSIKENITMGREVKEEELKRVLEMSGVKSFLNNTEEGLEKNAGQNGSNLSGGQRVRIALARMMISDPEIIILDEPLEGVDKIKEEEVIGNIRKYTENKTLIIISHRFSILSMATRIIGIEKGKVVLDDKRDKALKNNTILKEFFDAEKRMTKTNEENENE